MNMSMQLPLNALEIFIEWRLDDNGLGVTALTDELGLPYIGLYPLDWSGIPTGLPTYFQRRRLMADVVVGFVWGQPIVVFIDVEVTVRGLDLRLCLPVLLTPQGGYPRHLSARWGDPAPKFHGFPANNNWLVQPKLREID